MNSTMPIFGGPESVYKISKEEFCQNIVDRLRAAEEKLGENTVDDVMTPTQYLSQLTKGELLKIAATLDIPLGQLIPLEVNDTVFAEFRTEAQDRKVAMIANTGELSSDRANVRIMLQFDAIDAVCRPKIINEIPSLIKYRERLHERLVS